MIRRQIASVVAAAVLAVRLLAPDVGHACESSAHASALAAPTLASEASTDAHAHHHAAPSAPSTQASDGDHVHEGPASDASHPCDCDTACCCVATAVSLMRDTPPVAARYVSSSRVEFARGTARAAAWADHVLPFTTPPPSATLS